jgi:hypothetical protein
MAYEIRMGIPEMEALWNDLKQKHREGTASKQEERLYKKWGYEDVLGVWTGASTDYNYWIRTTSGR